MSNITRRVREIAGYWPATEYKGATLREAADTIDALVQALEDLYAMVWGECPSLLNEDSGGNGRLDDQCRAALAKARGGDNG